MKKIITLISLILLFSCSNDEDKKETIILSIADISPASGPKNTPVTITGSGFSAISSENAVTINDKVCPIINSTPTQITITIPPSAGSGKINLTVGNASAESNNFDFIVTTTVTTIAGNIKGIQDGQGSAAQFDFPRGITVDNQGNLLVTDGDRIRKISSTGLVTTIAGSTTGSEHGQSILAKFDGPAGIVIDESGRLFVADEFNDMIRLISNTGLVNTTAGAVTGSDTPAVSGFLDGNRFEAKFDRPVGIAIDVSGTLFVADSQNRRIRKIAGNNVTTFAGSGDFSSADGQGNTASFGNPQGLTIDTAGNLYVSDRFKIIRKITPTGLVTTIAGSTTGGFADGQGSVAKFNNANGIIADSLGNLFVTDGPRIRKISPTGLVSTIAGTATNGFADGIATIAQFNNPQGITIDSQGNLYIADTINFKIRKITFD
ncbi:IPT/TIG domain-containing protein [Flavobacterium sp.]|uniref:NHL domain-containing protein n=1 Tax=Flavobacterium sp. TaxID=239 RepID=UPI003265F78E